MHCLSVIFVSLCIFKAIVFGFPSEKSDLCQSSTCGVGATCSQVSTLIVCTCPDGYDGDAFEECKAPLSTSPSSSSSLPPSTTSAATTTTITTTTIPTTTTFPETSSTTTEVTNFNLPVKTHTYHEEMVVSTTTHQNDRSPISLSNIQQVHQHQQEKQQEQRNPQSNYHNNDEILTQFPSAPPTLSHYANSHTFKQRISTQPIQFNMEHNPRTPILASDSYPGGEASSSVSQHSGASSTGSNQQYQPELFSDTKTRQRPAAQQQQHSTMENEKYYYHDNVHVGPTINSRNNYNHGSPSSLAGTNNYYNDNSFTNNQQQNYPHHHHQQQQHYQNVPHTSHNSNNNHYNQNHGHGSGSQSQQGFSQKVDAGTHAGIVHDYNQYQRPTNNINYLPISSSNNNYNGNNHNNNNKDGQPQHEDLQDENRDFAFIKDPLGKYEKCHMVNNMIVCADNTGKQDTKGQSSNSHNQQQQQPQLENRRIDSRPISSNSNSHYNMDLPHPSSFPSSSNFNYYPQQHDQNNQKHYHPSNNVMSRHPTTDNNNHPFSQFSPERPMPQFPPSKEFTAPVTMITPSNNNDDPMCHQFCGEDSVCRIVLGRPVCGCSEGHTGDPTIKCYPILNSKFDTKSCQKHPDCSPSEICHETRCIDPCITNVVDNSSSGLHGALLSRSDNKSIQCGPNASCTVVHHTQLCSCNEGFSGNPFLGCTTR